MAIPRKLVVGALGLALVAAGTGVASAAQTRQSGGATTVTRHGIIPLRGHNAPRADAGDLEYHDGPIQQSPAVYLVFWGRQWKKDANGVQGYKLYRGGTYLSALGPTQVWVYRKTAQAYRWVARWQRVVGVTSGRRCKKKRSFCDATPKNSTT